MRSLFIIASVSLALASQANALTLKKGEVLGADGQVYDGASPDQMERIVEQARESGKAGGISGNNVFVVVGEQVTFVPTAELRGLSKESKLNVIGDRVIQDITGSDQITYSQVQAVTETAKETGIDPSELFSESGLEGLDPDVIKELEAVSGDTGIELENLVAVNAVLETLPAEQVEQIMADVGNMIEQGFADEIDQVLSDLSEIDGGIENFLQYDSLEDCQSSGGSNCEATAAAIEAANPG